MTSSARSPKSLSRRDWLQRSALAGGLGTAAVCGWDVASAVAAEKEFEPAGNIRHSIVRWCFNDHYKIRELCEVARRLGCQSIELLDPKDWPVLAEFGLHCAISGSHSFMQGMNHRKYHAGCQDSLRSAIDRCADAGVPTVITFTGFAADTGEWAGGKMPNPEVLRPDAPRIDPHEGLKNCVAGFKEVARYAEERKVNVSLEMLNSRVSDHPMKGHPGYQGDHVDYCMEIIRQVGSPRFGLLFDIYHVQIMDGDLIRRLRACREAINHVHTAGNPGRGEIDAHQEINYPPIMKELVAMGYRGYVGHEFIPTRDPLAGLREAIRTCDV